ncbi:fatty acid 2-hydroxylase [Chelonus insularis]|uniref:fatty acid 2-hydroxylase n=1 Tax=Chelonus insularis TaxID=460826 RepID=UPI00158DDCC8|nr:fatty acid 2-hydroxylase [Chelonus insularis]
MTPQVKKKVEDSLLIADSNEVENQRCNGNNLSYINEEKCESGDVNSVNINKFFVKYQGDTYEISDFLKNHPGGSQSLKAYKGLALDKIFTDVEHSKAAFHLFKEFKLNNDRAYEDIENLIDWKLPLLGQVGSLGDRYWEWVNLPVNRSIRLFKSDYLEILTITPWYLVPVVWIPICVYFLYQGVMRNASRLTVFPVHYQVLAFLWGLLLWTFLEYVLHRKLFHLKPPTNSPTLISLHFLIHGLHHKAPFDNQRLVFPPLAGIFIAFILYNLYKIVFSSMIDIVAAGTMTGYLCYDLIHYYLHYGSPKVHTYLYEMKRYHNYHHFTHHDEGFGISSKLWDYIFGSLIILRQLKKAIIW